MTPLTVAQLSARLLSYATYTAADSAQFPAGTSEALFDSIYGALLDIKNAAPGLFRKKVGGYLAGVTTTTAAVTTGAVAATLGGTYSNLRTLRIAGGKSDYSLHGVNGTSVTLSPAWEGSSGTPAAQIWHDAWNYTSGTTYQDCGIDTVRINGTRIEQVNDRAAAEARCGVDGWWSQGTSAKRATSGTDIPRVWWVERHLGTPYILVYPLPDAAVNIEAEVMHGHHAALVIADILTSTATFDLPADISVNVWRPLAIGRFRAFPLMTNVALGSEMERQIQKAERWLASIMPKKPGLRPWNSPRQLPPPLAGP